MNVFQTYYGHQGLKGYWEPHSSSVDFCEPNYMHSPYIAETHNVWSSVFISVLAVLGMIYCNPTHEWRTTSMFLALFVVGLGSVGLHATLHEVGQAADEIPMLWFNLSVLFALWNINSRNNTMMSGSGMAAVGVLQTLGYCTMRHVYGYFVFSFIATVSIVAIWSASIALSDRSSSNWPIRWWLYSRSFASFALIGGVPL